MNPPQVYTCSPSWTPLPPPSPYHPSGSFQCTSPKDSLSCIEPGLAILVFYSTISFPFQQTPESFIYTHSLQCISSHFLLNSLQSGFCTGIALFKIPGNLQITELTCSLWSYLQFFPRSTYKQRARKLIALSSSNTSLAPRTAYAPRLPPAFLFLFSFSPSRPRQHGVLQHSVVALSFRVYTHLTSLS